MGRKRGRSTGGKEEEGETSTIRGEERKGGGCTTLLTVVALHNGSCKKNDAVQCLPRPGVRLVAKGSVASGGGCGWEPGSWAARRQWRHPQRPQFVGCDLPAVGSRKYARQGRGGGPTRASTATQGDQQTNANGQKGRTEQHATLQASQCTQWQ
eukprot:3568660-Amphidinium_carterae.1